MRPRLVLVLAVCLGLLPAASAHAQSQGTAGSGPTYGSPAGRSPTTPGTPTGTTALPILPPGGQPNGGARTTTSSGNEYGTPIPGVTQR